MSSTLSRLSSWVNGKAWWVRINTEHPKYTYYFGPFFSRSTAQQKQPSFVEDLQAEQAVVAEAAIEWCAPEQITIPGDDIPNAVKALLRLRLFEDGFILIDK